MNKQKFLSTAILLIVAFFISGEASSSIISYRETGSVDSSIGSPNFVIDFTWDSSTDQLQAVQFASVSDPAGYFFGLAAQFESNPNANFTEIVAHNADYKNILNVYVHINPDHTLSVATLAETGLGGGVLARASTNFGSQYDKFTVAQITSAQLSAVPEPSTITLFIPALLGLGFAVRRKLVCDGCTVNF